MIPFVMHLLQRQSILNQFQLPLILYSNYTRCTFFIFHWLYYCLEMPDCTWTCKNKHKKSSKSTQMNIFSTVCSVGALISRSFALFQLLWWEEPTLILFCRYRSCETGENIKIRVQAAALTRSLLSVLNQVVSTANYATFIKNT